MKFVALPSFLSKFTFTHLSYLALISALSGVALMVVRGINLVSISEPLQITASGAEYESLYVIWKYINGLEVFSDHFQIPFAGTFYNWAYYAFYGELTQLVLNLLKLDDAWIPTITKLISFAGLVYGSVAAYLCFAELCPKDDANFKRLNWAFALFIFFGPIMGFFGVSTAPDNWALAFDVTAIFFFLRYYEKFPFQAVLLTCLFSYLAWSFKQIFIFTPGAVGLYLLIKRDWKWLIIFSAITWAGWLVTLTLGGDQYFKSMLQFGGTKVTLEMDRLLRNLDNGLPKLAAPLFGLFAVLVIWGRELMKGASVNDFLSLRTPNLTLFSVVGLVFVVVISIPPSAKQGAAENYYFSMSFFMSLTLVAGTVWVITRPGIRSMALAIMAVGWLINLVGVGSVLAGVNGKLSNRYIHREFVLTVNCLREVEMLQPAFIGDSYLALPWMISADQHFVVQTSYIWDRAAGIPMQDGGIGGLIDKGYFGTVVISEKKIGNFDGSDLSKYELSPIRCRSYVIYYRKPETN